MTIENFMKNYGLKSRKTVLSWVDNDLLPGADVENNYVPDSQGFHILVQEQRSRMLSM